MMNRSTAASGELFDREVLSRQARRRIDDPRSARTARRFFFKWLGIDRLMQVVRDSEVYAALYFELREMMLDESALLLDELWRADAPLSDLFLFLSWVSEELAEYYQVATGDPHPSDQGYIAQKYRVLAPVVYSAMALS